MNTATIPYKKSIIPESNRIDMVREENLVQQHEPAAMMALAKVLDRNLGQDFQIARAKLKEVIDRRGAERLKAFMDRIANKD